MQSAAICEILAAHGMTVVYNPYEHDTFVDLAHCPVHAASHVLLTSTPTGKSLVLYLPKEP